MRIASILRLPLVSRITKVIAFVAVLFLSFLTYGKQQRKQGAISAHEDMIQEDVENANRIRKDMDRAKDEAEKLARDADIGRIIDGLRQQGRLRD